VYDTYLGEKRLGRKRGIDLDYRTPGCSYMRGSKKERPGGGQGERGGTPHGKTVMVVEGTRKEREEVEGVGTKAEGWLSTNSATVLDPVIN
jgi:hypothetical protein